LAIIHGNPIDWKSVRDWFPDSPPDSVIVTGTNLHQARALISQWPDGLPSPALLTEKSQLPIRMDVDAPEKVGMDRLLNGVAANVLRGSDQPVIVIDTGTAITIDLLDSQGTFKGGAILPGILLGAKTLHEETTTLPLVDVWELLKREPPALGKNTEAAIAAGLYWGHLGAVKEIVNRYRQLCQPAGREPLLLLTGGAAVILAPYLPQGRCEPALSLQGLAVTARIIHEFGTAIQ
jgi:type III pantothenate kinase